jgi:hypothetical protein
MNELTLAWKVGLTALIAVLSGCLYWGVVIGSLKGAWDDFHHVFPGNSFSGAIGLFLAIFVFIILTAAVVGSLYTLWVNC